MVINRLLLLPAIVLLLTSPAVAGEPVVIAGSVPLLWLRASDNLMGAEGVQRAMVESSAFSGVALEAVWGPVVLSVGYLQSITRRRVVSFLPPYSTVGYHTPWQAGFVTAGLRTRLAAELAPGWELTGGAGLSYWANVLYHDQESGNSRASLTEEARTELDELFVTLETGVRHTFAAQWSWSLTLEAGYNLLGAEADWAAMAEAAPELAYWPADVFIGLSAGVVFRLR